MSTSSPWFFLGFPTMDAVAETVQQLIEGMRQRSGFLCSDPWYFMNGCEWNSMGLIMDNY